MKKRILRMLKKEENYWNEYEDNLESSINESNNNESSQNESSFDEKRWVIKENKK